MPSWRADVHGKADVVEMALDDAWARDFGPTFVKMAQLFAGRQAVGGPHR